MFSSLCESWVVLQTRADLSDELSVNVWVSMDLRVCVLCLHNDLYSCSFRLHDKECIVHRMPYIMSHESCNVICCRAYINL